MSDGLLGPNIDVFICVRMPWSEEARNGLRDTFFEAEARIEAGVKSGQMELYHVNGNSWLVIERMGGMFFIWCYQGRGLVCLIHQLREYAKANGFEQLSFFTYHRAVIRALRRYKMREYKTHTPREIQYVIDVRQAA